MIYPVHGGWASWSVSRSCSVTCGNGTEIISRSCTNPTPNHGGTPCQGASTKEQTCVLKPCPSKYACFILLFQLFSRSHTERSYNGSNFLKIINSIRKLITTLIKCAIICLMMKSLRIMRSRRFDSLLLVLFRL